MLTAITLQNFKGIADPLTIPIRPLTIMFGKNSAGKSTVVQALHYAREVLLHNNPDADRTIFGGSAIDLGGFRNLVHKRDYKNRAIVMRFDLDLSGYDELPRYDVWGFLDAFDTIVGKNDENQEIRADLASAQKFIEFQKGKDLNSSFIELSYDENRSEDDPAELVSLEFVVQWSATLGKPVLTSYKTWLKGVEAGRILTSLDERNVSREININHPFLLDEDDTETDRSGKDVAWNPVTFLSLSSDPKHLSLPDWGKPIYLMPDTEIYRYSVGYQSVSQIFVAPGDLVCRWLGEFRYLGPIRQTPPRHFQPSHSENEAEWANGLAAWTVLYRRGAEFVNSVGRWLGNNGLKAGYSILLKQVRETPLKGPLHDADESPIHERLVIVEEATDLELMPSDIGIGISQVVPVIVAALDSQSRIIAVEQPELHLHPAVQAELGDLFIESIQSGYGNICLVETHSEHLILRVLRRIRETSADIETTTRIMFENRLSLIYIGKNLKTGETEITSLRVDDRGRIVDRVPGGFFEEDFAEIF